MGQQSDHAPLRELDSYDYEVFARTGCTNWKDARGEAMFNITFDGCQTWCNTKVLCKSFNWQPVPCDPEPGWPVTNGCILFLETCEQGENPCQDLWVKGSIRP